MYSVLSYGAMAVDIVRSDAYFRAINKTVRPGSIVLDIGCGTGFMSLLALRAGARRVHAVDMDPSVWLARDLAVANGFGDKLVVHQGSSFDLTLDETQRADVIVADLRGSSPLFGQNVASIEDAKRRLLAPGGIHIPLRDRLFVGLADTEAQRGRLARGWSPYARHGFDAEAARLSTLNCAYTDDDNPVQANHILSDAKEWAEIRYGEPFSPSLSATVELGFHRGGTVHSLAIWFEATLCDGITFTNAPGNALVYKRIVLPLLEPVAVSVGDKARVTIRTDIGGDQWAWETEIAGRPRVRQSTFLGLPASPQSLLRDSAAATPARSSAGDRATRILGLMDGSRSVKELIELACAAEPGVRRDAIAEEVKTCVRRYSR